MIWTTCCCPPRKSLLKAGKFSSVYGLRSPLPAISFNPRRVDPQGMNLWLHHRCGPMKVVSSKRLKVCSGLTVKSRGVLSRSGSLELARSLVTRNRTQVPQSKDPFAAARVKGETSTRGGDARRALFGDEPAQPPALTLPSPPQVVFSPALVICLAVACGMPNR